MALMAVISARSFDIIPKSLNVDGRFRALLILLSSFEVKYSFHGYKNRILRREC